MIQKLRIDGTIEGEAAQHSVICAVALMSDGNINTTSLRKPDAVEGEECPICAEAVAFVPHDDRKRCAYCFIEGAIWKDTVLVEEHEKAKKAAVAAENK